MKKIILTTLMLPLVGIFSPQLAVAASPWLNPGTICHNKLQGEANFFNFQSNGIVNGSSATRNISCPIITQDTTGTPGTIFIRFTSTVSTTCTLYTHDWNLSSLKATQVVPLPSGGSLATISNVPNSTFYQHTLECSLPGLNRVKIRGIEANF